MRTIYSSLLQGTSSGHPSPIDPTHLTQILSTTPSNDLYCFSQDSEILLNVKRFYSLLQSQRSLSAPQLQQALVSLLSFRSSNMLWSSAVVTVLRCCYLLHPNDAVNDMVADYCFQYVRLLNGPPNDPNFLAKKKEGVRWYEGS